MTEHRDEKGRLAMAQSAIAKRMRKKSGESTPKTKKYRVAVRGEERAGHIANEAAAKYSRREPVEEKHSRKLLFSATGKMLSKKHAKLGSKEAWERRRLASMPGSWKHYK